MPTSTRTGRVARRQLLKTAVAAAVAGIAPWAGAASPTRSSGPPLARVEPVSDSYFGQTVVDPYRWMENPKDNEWEPFMRGQDAHARATLRAIPGRDALKARIAALSGGTPIAFGVQSAGGRVFYQVRPAGPTTSSSRCARGWAARSAS